MYLIRNTEGLRVKKWVVLGKTAKVKRKTEGNPIQKDRQNGYKMDAGKMKGEDEQSSYFSIKIRSTLHSIDPLEDLKEGCSTHHIHQHKYSPTCKHITGYTAIHFIQI